MAEGAQGAGVAGSVIVEIRGDTSQFEAKLAQARQMSETFSSQMTSSLSGSASAALSKIGAVATETSAALSKATAPATAAVAKIEQVGTSAVMAAAGVKDLTVANAGLAAGADVTTASLERTSYSAKEFAAALAATGGNMERALTLLVGTTDGTVALAKAQTEAAVATDAVGVAASEATGKIAMMGAATAETTRLTTGASIELGRIGHALVTGQWGRATSEVMTLGTRLGEAGTSALTFGTIAKSVGSFASVFINPYVVGLFAIGIGMDLAIKAIEHMTAGHKTAADSAKEWTAALKEVAGAYPDIEKAAQAAFEAANRTPKGAVASDLGKQLQDQQAAIKAYQADLDAFQQHTKDVLAGDVGYFTDIRSIGKLPNDVLAPESDLFKSVKASLDAIMNVDVSSGSGLGQIDAAITSITKLLNSGTPNSGLVVNLRSALEALKTLHAEAIATSLAFDEAQFGSLTKSKQIADSWKTVQEAIDPKRSGVDKAIDTMLASEDAIVRKAGEVAKAQVAAASSAKAFADEIASLNKEATDNAIAQYTDKLSPFNKALVDAALKADLVKQAVAGMDGVAKDADIVAMVKELAKGDWGLFWAKGLTSQVQQLYAALRQAAAAKTALGQTYTVPNSSGTGTSDVTVYRAGPSGQGGYAPGVNGSIGQTVGGEFPNGGGPITSTFDPVTGVTVDRGNPVSTYGYNPVYGPNPFADGGPVKGPGTGTSDSIFARLSNGEFVMSAAATSKYLGILNAMNDNRFATGGLVNGQTIVPGGAHATVPTAATFQAHDIASLIALLKQGIDLSQITGITTSGSSKTGTTSTTNFNFDLPAGVSANGQANNGDPGLIAFDQAHPHWAEEVAQAMELDQHGFLGFGGIHPFGGDAGTFMANQRLSHATNYQTPAGPRVYGSDYAQAFAWAANNDSNFLDSMGALAGGDLSNGLNSAFGMPRFATGGAILPGPDSQQVQLFKSPDEAVGVFTPSQRKAIGDAVGGKAGDTFNNVFHLSIGQVNTKDGRLSSQSRSEMQDIMARAVRSALSPRGR